MTDYREVLSESAGFVGWEQFFGSRQTVEVGITAFSVEDVAEFDDPKVKKKAVILEFEGVRTKAPNPLLTGLHGATGHHHMEKWVGRTVRLRKTKTRFGTPSCELLEVLDD